MGIFSLPFCDWCPPRVYSLSLSAIGARYGYILSPLLRLVPATGVFSHPATGRPRAEIEQGGKEAGGGKPPRKAAAEAKGGEAEQ
eukprot:3996228-Pyramimonas_sp.AAC.1